MAVWEPEMADDSQGDERAHTFHRLNGAVEYKAERRFMQLPLVSDDPLRSQEGVWAAE